MRACVYDPSFMFLLDGVSAAAPDWRALGCKGNFIEWQCLVLLIRDKN